MLTDVGSYPAGQSFYGLLDMAGNVWEWTSSNYKDYPYKADDGREDPTGNDQRSLRGGAVLYNDDVVRCAYRNGFFPDLGYNLVGFRVVSPGF